MKSTKHIHFLIILTLICLSSFALISAASAGPVNIIYVTDVANPFPLDNSLGFGSDVNFITFLLPDELTSFGAASADIVFIDVRSMEQLSALNNVDLSTISDTVITFTKDESTNIFSATVDSVSNVPNADAIAAQYWSRHPTNLENLILWSANEFCGENLGTAGAPIDITDPDNRTSILLVVTPNTVAISSIFDEVSDYGIDLKFANLTALTNASRDPDFIPDVLKEIDDFDGDIILEIAAPTLNPKYLPNIRAVVDDPARGPVAIIGAGLTLNNSSVTVLQPGNTYSEQDIKNASNYWVTVLPENLIRMFIYMSAHADGRSDLFPLIKPTMQIPTIGIYHPNAPTLTYGTNDDKLPHLFDNRTKYNDWYSDYKTANNLADNGEWIAISSYNRDYQEGKMHTEDLMVQKLENEGYNVIVFYHPNSSVDAFFSANSADNKPVDVFIHFQTFGYNVQLNKYDAPVLEAVLLSSYTSLEEWQEDPNGLKKSTFYYKIDQSEIGGSLFPVGVEIQMTVDDPIPYPIEDRVDRILGQAKGYSNLRHTPNADKKVALIYFNHPPGKQNVGASYFDLFGSLEKIFVSMNGEGYKIDSLWTQDDIYQKIMTGGRNVGGWAPGELEKLVDEGVKDGSVVLLPVSTYEGWVSNLPSGRQKIIEDITAEWGAPGVSDFMTVTRGGVRYFVLPVIKNSDNIIMAPEPARGWEEDIEKLYHDMNIPVPHQYAAFYLWLQKPESEGGFGADAMVHLGRHGTQEFLPGKMVCLDESSAADLMVGDVPNIYPYIVDGSGEALQAKRRGYATLISHLTPPIAQSGLYGELANLNGEIVSYERAKSGGSGNEDAYKQSILAILETSTIVNDLGIDASRLSTDNQYFEDSLEEITEYLEIITQQSIPYGTHVFGESLSDEKLSLFIETIYADKMYSISLNILNLNSADYADRDEARQFSYLLPLMIVESPDAAAFISAVQAEAGTSLTPPQEADLTDLYNKASDTITKLDAISEMTGLMMALDGKYIDTSPLGDPVRKEEVLPTGRNMVGFVSNTIPTRVAEQIGIRMADEMLSAYYIENGHFPEKIGVVLWSVETFRHDGVMEAMAIHLMGGKISRANDTTTTVTNTAVTVIPEANLKVEVNGVEIPRPRVDVVFTISGLYRDTLPYQIRLLDKAVSTISAHSTDTAGVNHVRKNSLDMETQLNALNNADKEEIIRNYKEADPSYTGGLSDFGNLAAQLSKIRIFGPPPESYGTGIEKEIEAGQGWDSDSAMDQIAELYIFRMANMYTVNSAGDIIFLGNFGKVFEMNLKGVEIVTNSRSSNLYGILDNDDFFQYVGGMSIAVQSLDENKMPPQVQIVNLRVSGKESVQSLETFLKTELRARALNDKYLEGMINSGYSGMKEISELVDNLWGWQVTTPHAVGDYMWDDVYTKLVTDPTVSDAFKASNPYAYQSMLTRMIDANAKGYWTPSDAATIQNLAKELAESVAASGVACCHHTCGNPTLNNHIAGILSIPGVVEDDVRKQWQQLTESATNVKITPTGVKNTGKSSSGTGLAKILEAGVSSDGSQAGQNEPIPTSRDPENSGQGAGTDSGVTPGQSVVGYEMTVFESATNSIRDFLENPTFSATSVIALLFAIGIVGALFYGFRRKGI